MIKSAEISQRKLEANRRNAQKSTGPRSEEGKHRSSRNATTHGFFCQDLVLPGESKKFFLILRQQIIAQLKPQNVVELTIVDRYVSATWKLRRLQSAEMMMFDLDLTACVRFGPVQCGVSDEKTTMLPARAGTGTAPSGASRH